LGILGNRSATVQADTELAASCLLNLLENHCVDNASAQPGEGQVAGVAHHEAFRTHSTPEHVLDNGVHLADLAHDTLLDGLPHGWHADQDGRLEFCDVTAALADGVVGDGLRVAVSHGTTPPDAGGLEDKLENVCKREIC
jgi:hypothetical protein